MRMLPIAVAFCLLTGTALADPGRGANGSGEHGAKRQTEHYGKGIAEGRSSFNKKANEAYLDSIYDKEVKAWNDYQATGSIKSWQDAWEAGHVFSDTADFAAVDKTVTRSYDLNKNFECCDINHQPVDADGDGFADGSVGDPAGAAAGVSASTGKNTRQDMSSDGHGSAGTFSSPGPDVGGIGDIGGIP